MQASQKLKKMAIKGSSSEEEEEEACSSSSNDEKEPMDPQPLHASQEDEQILARNQLNGVYGPHHQQMKIERRFKKKKEKNEKKPKHESFAIFGEWVSGGEESSASSSDKSSKRFTTRTNFGSSSNTYLMAKGMENDVSDDVSDSLSYEELLELVHEHQKVIKKQSNEIENLNALNDLNAIFATNYENFLCKFKLLSEEHEELKLKIESINDAIDFLEIKHSTPSTSSNSKVDASTSCFDLIDESNPCNKKRL